MESDSSLETCSLSTRTWLAYAYASAGKQSAARTVLKELDARRKSEYLAEYLLALPYVALGETETALRLLEQAFDKRVEEMYLINVDPALRPLHSHPRFLVLVKKMNLLK
jgi:Tfp pilus assembly protein PilF